jgi:hypothetical protein
MDRHTLLTAFGLFAGFLLLYGLTARSEIQVSDEAATFATGISLATQGDLAIDELQWLQDAVNIGQPGRDGHLYAKYFPGNVLSVAVVYRLVAVPDRPYFWNGKDFAPSEFGARLALKLNAFLGAAALSVLFFALRERLAWAPAVITVVLFGVGTDWWYQSRGFLSEVGAGLFLLTSIWLALRDNAAGSSFALGLSLLFRPTNLLGMAPWALAVWRDWRRRWPAVVWIGAGLAGLAAYNWIRYRSIINFGYADEQFTTQPLVGLYGALLSPGRSLFLYSPLLLLAIPGAWLWHRREPAFSTGVSATVLGYILSIAMWHSWEGGWAWGSRLLTPVVPVLGLLCGPVIERMLHTRVLWLPVIALTATGVVIQLLALARDPLAVMITQVAAGQVPFEDTLFTLERSWVALHSNSLSTWTVCDVDAHTLKSVLGCLP